MEIFTGLSVVLSSPTLLMWIFAAAVIGMVFGAVPGLTASAAIAMMLPLILYMDPLSALAFFYVIGKSGRYGGSIAAILFNTPGTAASAATQLDGFPRSQMGQSSKAMKVATVSSAIGDFIGELLLIIAVGSLASIALKLGPPELFAVYLAAFIIIASVISESVVKGLLSAVIGVLLGTVGLDPITAEGRFTFGWYQLDGGISLIPLMIGIFVLGEVFEQLEHLYEDVKLTSRKKASRSDSNLTWKEYRPCLPHVFRSSLIGSGIGLIPGLGSAIAAFVAYSEGKRRALNPQDWGKGALEGIAAPEAANNAVSGPSMAPLLTLGIPGSTIGAVLLGVFMMLGVQVGPTLLLSSKSLVYSLFAAGLIGIVIYGLVGYYAASWLGRMILNVPTRILYPLIFLITFISAFSSRGSLFDVWVMIFAGLIGWLMRKLKFNLAALVISFVLAGGAEEAFRQSLRLSENGVLIFVERPISLIFLLLAAVVVMWRVHQTRRIRNTGKPKLHLSLEE
jgi:putative tricarboxylic transport membrane protein